MDSKGEAKVAISEMISGVDWMNPYLLDEIKEKFKDISEESIDAFYLEALQQKILSMSVAELKAALTEQEQMTSANQNFLLQELIEQQLESA